MWFIYICSYILWYMCIHTYPICIHKIYVWIIYIYAYIYIHIHIYINIFVNVYLINATISYVPFDACHDSFVCTHWIFELTYSYVCSDICNLILLYVCRSYYWSRQLTATYVSLLYVTCCICIRDTTTCIYMNIWIYTYTQI